MDERRLLEDIAVAAREAGEAILEIVRRGYEVEHKQDSSPVTEADRAAELIILAALAKAAPGVPVIAEEEVAAGRIPAHGDTYFLVDPLDGTKEFVRGGDDYTVNIGLIVDGVPRLGAVYAPANGRLHGGLVGEGAWLEDLSGRIAIQTRSPGDELVAVASKSHFNQPTADYLAEAVGECGYVAIGSSLKFCIVAEGRADIYPRLSPTSEWDTAAGHAVLLAAGGRVDGPDGQPLAYGKRAFLNRGFVATGGWKATVTPTCCNAASSKPPARSPPAATPSPSASTGAPTPPCCAKPTFPTTPPSPGGESNPTLRIQLNCCVEPPAWKSALIGVAIRLKTAFKQ